MVSPLSCPLGTLQPAGVDRTYRWMREARSSTSSILCLDYTIRTGENIQSLVDHIRSMSPCQWLSDAYTSPCPKSRSSRHKIAWKNRIETFDADLTVEGAVRAKPPHRGKGGRVGEDHWVVVDVVGVDQNHAVGGHHVVADVRHMWGRLEGQWIVLVDPQGLLDSVRNKILR